MSIVILTHHLKTHRISNNMEIKLPAKVRQRKRENKEVYGKLRNLIKRLGLGGA